MTATLLPEPEAQAAPVPEGRGRWHLTLHSRQFSPASSTSTMIAELPGARSRRLEQALNASATLTFTLDGRTPAAAMIRELMTDVVAWRWDDATGKDVPYFRGIVTQSQDTLSEQLHTVTFTAHDYLAMLARRFMTKPFTLTNYEQDRIAFSLVDWASNYVYDTSGAVLFSPGSYLPIVVHSFNPDGTERGPSGQMRTRTYAGNTQYGTALDQLAHVINGFDYDVVPGMRGPFLNSTFDWLRIFYPNQGVVRSEPLEYGSSISAAVRSVNSADYANFVRVLGNNGSSDPAAAQVYAEQWNGDANDVTTSPVGLWMAAENGADVSVTSTLTEQAQGTLDLMGVLEPSYSLTLRPGTYREGAFNMGDTVPIVIRSGRLNVTPDNATLRIVGLTFEIGDDGNENVGLTVGRSLTELADLLTETARDVNALARR